MCNEAWTEKYRPRILEDVIGHEGHIKTMRCWLREFKDNSKETKKILLLCGPPGIGKTTIAHLLLKDSGYRVLEYNASDNRSGKKLSAILKKVVGRLNVMDMMYGRRQSSGLVLDEIDGLKGTDGDRGGLSEIFKCIKNRNGKTMNVPIICTYNPFSSRNLTKLKKLGVCVILKRPGKYHCRELINRIDVCEQLRLEDEGIVQILKYLIMENYSNMSSIPQRTFLRRPIFAKTTLANFLNKPGRRCCSAFTTFRHHLPLFSIVVPPNSIFVFFYMAPVS